MISINPNKSVDISATEQVTSVSTGKVSKTNWSATSGYANQKQIEKERQDTYQANQDKQDPTKQLELRLQMMELAINDLQAKYEGLKDA